MSQKQLLNSATKTAIQHSIMQLVMMGVDFSNRGLMHVFVDYSGHVESIHLHAHPADQVYEDGHEFICLMDERIYLGRDNPVEKLNDAIERLEAIGRQIEGKK